MITTRRKIRFLKEKNKNSKNLTFVIICFISI